MWCVLLHFGRDHRCDCPGMRNPECCFVANKKIEDAGHALWYDPPLVIADIASDVLHTHSMVELPPAVWDQAARRGIPVVHTLHDYDLLCIRGALFKSGRRCETRHVACRVLSAPKRRLHDRIDAVAAVSRTVLDTHLQHGLFAHLPAERRQVIWNPARLERSDAPRGMPQAGQGLRFGFLGRLVGEKGLGTLLEACRHLPASGWSLDIAGEGNARAAFEEQARGLPIRFHGYVDAASFLGSVDVLICTPIWDEPFGLTTVEAYAAGCRVIGSASGVIGEVVERVDPGWTVPSGDVPALAAAMQRAIAADAALPESCNPAVQALLAELEPVRVANRYLDLYHAAQGPAAPRRAALG